MKSNTIAELRERKTRHRIPLADWLKKYMDPLGFGIGVAISSLSVMQNYIKKGEWNQVAEPTHAVHF